MGSNRRYSGAALVFCGGALGTLLRYLIDVASVRVSGFALDIFIINVVGAFILAFLVGWITGAGEPTRNELRLRLFLGTGVMGGFTTYSTLAVETAHNLGDGRWTSALVYSLGTVLVGALLSVAGVLAGRRAVRARRLGRVLGETR
ncbi:MULTISPECIES: CrcB family protein [unclassified Schaalia]|uniref:fluoride efflux transporter FluC n=1 Tax=unclassified Schaalia TaxID=2691889 RepID=UPI0015F4B0F3|nr:MULTISPECIES: CrcB family protein [unclassified Schaalia]